MASEGGASAMVARTRLKDPPPTADPEVGASVSEREVGGGVHDVRPRTAFTAIPVRDVGGVSTALARVPCRCGVRSVPEISRENVRFAERRMIVVIRVCGACGRRQDVYFDVDGGTPPRA